MEMDAKNAISKGIVDSYFWHQRLWECFPDQPDKKRDFLSRIDIVEGAFRLWLLARCRPRRPDWCLQERFSLKEIAPSFLRHRFYAFDLWANPTKTKVLRGPNGETLRRPNGKREHGKRIPLVDREELRAWITQKGNVRCKDCNTGVDVPGGFRIVEEKPLEIRPMAERYFRKKDHYGYHGGVQFRGTLEVTDSEKFEATYHQGIGSAKGFGFGLFLLSPVNF
jgi:CRISPR system Cascade subunit CasE